MWGLDKKYFNHADWLLIAKAFYVCVSLSPKLELPITAPTDEKSKEEPWHYQNRTWNLYSHMLAKSYGWTMEYIANLPVLDALAHIQEILVDEQLEREFIYDLSEVAYSYDQRSKTSKHVPLPRPYWMRPKVKGIQEIKTFKIPASALPMGNVNYDAIPEELRPKASHN